MRSRKNKQIECDESSRKCCIWTCRLHIFAVQCSNALAFYGMSPGEFFLFFFGSPHFYFWNGYIHSYVLFVCFHEDESCIKFNKRWTRLKLEQQDEQKRKNCMVSLCAEIFDYFTQLFHRLTVELEINFKLLYFNTESIPFSAFFFFFGFIEGVKEAEHLSKDKDEVVNYTCTVFWAICICARS